MRAVLAVAAAGLATIGGCLVAQQTGVIGAKAGRASLASFLVDVGYRQLIFGEPITGAFLPESTRRRIVRSDSPDLAVARIYNAAFLGMPPAVGACRDAAGAAAAIVCDVLASRQPRSASRSEELRLFFAAIQMLRSDQAHRFLLGSGLPRDIVRPSELLPTYTARTIRYFCVDERDAEMCRLILSTSYSVSTYHGYVLQLNAAKQANLRNEGIMQMLSSSYANSDYKNFVLFASIAANDIRE